MSSSYPNVYETLKRYYAINLLAISAYIPLGYETQGTYCVLFVCGKDIGSIRLLRDSEFPQHSSPEEVRRALRQGAPQNIAEPEPAPRASRDSSSECRFSRARSC